MWSWRRCARPNSNAVLPSATLFFSLPSFLRYDMSLICLILFFFPSLDGSRISYYSAANRHRSCVTNWTTCWKGAIACVEQKDWCTLWSMPANDFSQYTTGVSGRTDNWRGQGVLVYPNNVLYLFQSWSLIEWPARIYSWIFTAWTTTATYSTPLW